VSHQIGTVGTTIINIALTLWAVLAVALTGASQGRAPALIAVEGAMTAPKRDIDEHLIAITRRAHHTDIEELWAEFKALRQQPVAHELRDRRGRRIGPELMAEPRNTSSSTSEAATAGRPSSTPVTSSLEKDVPCLSPRCVT